MKRQKTIFIIILSLISFNVFSQFKGRIVKGELFDMFVCVNLFPNNKYLTDLQTVADGEIYSYCLSTGNYSYNKDTVILTDTYYNYSLKFLHKDDKLISVQSYLWLSDISLQSYNNQYYNEEYVSTIDNIQKYYKPVFCQKDSANYKLSFQKYQIGNYSLILNQDNYDCMIDNFVISKGKFNYNNNCLKFYDDYLNFSFDGFISAKGIYLNFMPFYNVYFR